MGHFRSDSFISNEGQTIPQNTNDWNNFIYNAENKTELTNFFLRYFFLNIFTFFKTTFHWIHKHPGDNTIWYKYAFYLHLSRSWYTYCFTRIKIHKTRNHYSYRYWRSSFKNGMCKILSEFHSITGCNTASYPFGVEKRIPFKKMRRLNKMHLLYGKKKHLLV